MPFPEEQGILIQYQGGLGNQLWMVAAGFAAAQRYDCPLYLAENSVNNNKHNRFQQDYRNTVFSLIGQRLEMPFEAAVAAAEAAGWKKHWCPGFSEWLPHDIKPGTILTSYYQYYPTICRFQDEIRDLLVGGLKEQLEYVRFKFKPDTTVAFLHIRRGDYLNAPEFHYIQPLDYYRWCIADLQKKRPDLTRIIVFSDDVGWVRRHAFFQRPLFQIVDIPNELESLALMSCCGGGAICANSTFSWWGAFLGGTENVYVPERWIAEPIVCLFPATWAIVSPETYKTEFQDPNTVFVTLTDAGYFEKAKRTIRETRERGGWRGNIVLITVNFYAAEADSEFLRLYGAQEYPVGHINTDGLVAALRANPIKPMPDGRHFSKLTQWDKIYSFSPFFRRWRRVVFLDAGMRILDSVQPLLNLQWEGRFLAPDDSEPFDNGNRFRCQLDLEANPAVLTELLTEYPQGILDQKYFLNCMYVYDTGILDKLKMADLEAAMNKYPISLCNEMGIMNLLITIKHGLWTPFPHRTDEGKYLFGWNERNYPEGPSWESFHFMKYPATI